MLCQMENLCKLKWVGRGFFYSLLSLPPVTASNIYDRHLLLLLWRFLAISLRFPRDVKIYSLSLHNLRATSDVRLGDRKVLLLVVCIRYFSDATWHCRNETSCETLFGQNWNNVVDKDKIKAKGKDETRWIVKVFTFFDNKSWTHLALRALDGIIVA